MASNSKIALLLPSLNGGGAERVALFMAEVLDAAAYKVQLPVSVASGPLVDHPVARRFMVDLGAPNEMLSAPHIARYYRRERPDLVIAIVHSAKIMAGLARLWVRDMPLALSIHAALDIPWGNRFWLRRFFGHGPERWLYRGVLGCHVVSQALGEQVVARFGIPADKVSVIYNALPERGPVPPLPLAHEPWFDRPVVMTAGRLHPQKDHAAMIRAFAASGLAGRARLLILGEGALDRDLKALAGSLGLSDAVIFGGFQPDIRPYLARSKGFVLSSRFEGFALVLAEAIAAGCPVASFDCPSGPREVLEGGRMGRLIAPGDAAGLAAAMRDMVEGRLVAPDAAAVAASMARFSPPRIAGQYLAFVDACLKRSKHFHG